MREDLIPTRASELDLFEVEDGLIVQKGADTYMLNATGAEIFRNCDGMRTVHEIVNAFTCRHPYSDSRSAAMDFLDRIFTNGLLDRSKTLALSLSGQAP